MISYNRRMTFEPWMVEAFDRAERIVEILPEPEHEDEKYVWRCHEVARVVHAVLDDPRIGLVDGVYGFEGFPMIDHSYLTLHGERNGKLAVLDVYAVGRLPQVQLIDNTHELAGMYRARKARDDIRNDVIVELLAAVARRAA